MESSRFRAGGRARPGPRYRPCFQSEDLESILSSGRAQPSGGGELLQAFKAVSSSLSTYYVPGLCARQWT